MDFLTLRLLPESRCIRQFLSVCGIIYRKRSRRSSGNIRAHNSSGTSPFSTSIPPDRSKPNQFMSFTRMKASHLLSPRFLTSSQTRIGEVAEVQSKLIYSDDNILAFNKPLGKSVFGGSGNDVDDSTKCTLFDEVRQEFDQSNAELQVGLSLKSFYSGVVLFSKNRFVKEKLDKYLVTATTQKSPFLTYLAITEGRPRCPENVPLTAYISRVFLHGREMSIITDKNSNTARKLGTMMQTCFSVRILATNTETTSTLAQIAITKDRWDALPVLLTQYLSPVLGDHVYSSRCHHVMGVPFLSQPHSVKPKTQRLSRSTAEILTPMYPSAADIPLHLHRYQVTLPNFKDPRSSSVVVTAPPSSDFIRVLKSLGLHRDYLFHSSEPIGNKNILV